MSDREGHHSSEIDARGTSRRDVLASVDTPDLQRLIEIRVDQAVHKILVRWGLPLSLGATAIAGLLGYLGVNVNAHLSEGVKAADGKIVALREKADEDMKQVSKKASLLESTLTGLQQKAELFQSLSSEKERLRSAEWFAMIQDERQRSRSDASRLEADLENRARAHTQLIDTLRKKFEAEIAATEALRGTVGRELDLLKNVESSLGALPTVQFVVLRRDTPVRLDLEPFGPRVMLTLIHTRTWKGQNGAELTITVPDVGARRYLLTENNRDNLLGTDFRIQLMFAYDFPVFGATVDFVMLKVWREYETEGLAGPG